MSRSFCAKVALALAGILLTGESALALRCGSKLVTEGMHISEVIALCGEPAYEDYRTVLVNEFIPLRHSGRLMLRRNDDGHLVSDGFGPVIREVTITELTYNFGRLKLMRLLIFRNGFLAKIEQLGYGYRD